MDMADITDMAVDTEATEVTAEDTAADTTAMVADTAAGMAAVTVMDTVEAESTAVTRVISKKLRTSY